MQSSPTEPSHTIDALECPYCRKAVSLDPEGRVAGAAVKCPGCGHTTVLELESLGHGGHRRWELVENGDDDEP